LLKTNNPKLSFDVDKLKLELETIKFNYEVLMTSSAQVVEKVDKLRMENKKIIETINTILVINNPNPSKQETNLIKAIENVDSLDEFVYKKDFKDAVEHLTISIEDLVNLNIKSYREIM